MNVTVYAYPEYVTGTATPSGAKWLTFGKGTGTTVVDVCLAGLPPAVADALLAAAEGTPTCPAS